MTARGKIVLTIIILAVVGLGVAAGGTKSLPKAGPTTQSLNIDEVKKAVEAAKAVPPRG